MDRDKRVAPALQPGHQPGDLCGRAVRKHQYRDRAAVCRLTFGAHGHALYPEFPPRRLLGGYDATGLA